MGQVPRPETERDLKLIEDYLLKDESGEWAYSISQLGVKYAREQDGQSYPLTPARIHQILNKHNISKKRVTPKKKRRSKKKV